MRCDAFRQRRRLNARSFDFTLDCMGNKSNHSRQRGYRNTAHTPGPVNQRCGVLCGYGCSKLCRVHELLEGRSRLGLFPEGSSGNYVSQTRFAS